jgi:uncharacterized repeat protein (TIGR03806 family)
MRPVFLLSLLLTVVQFLSSCSNKNAHIDLDAPPYKKLSEYAFFSIDRGELKPNQGVTPYLMVNQMFNDHLQREKFLFLPDKKAIKYDSIAVLAMPLGSCLINTAYYLNNGNLHERKNIETQLLIHKKNGWEALEYIWNDAQTDAELSLIGDIKNLAWKDKKGIEMKMEYVLSSKHQCKNCHWNKDHITPIGFRAGNLNLLTNGVNQLASLNEKGLLADFSTNAPTPKFADWRDTSYPIFTRVKSYFDINCAHCHNTDGSANFCGLFLNRENENMETFGVYKSPTSAAKGSCDLKNDIVPGKPGESIVICRMASTDLKIKMPPLGRATNDNEGVALVIEWIAQMKTEQTQH